MALGAQPEGCQELNPGLPGAQNVVAGSSTRGHRELHPRLPRAYPRDARSSTQGCRELNPGSQVLNLGAPGA